MFRKFGLPILAVLGLCIAVMAVIKGNRPVPAAAPVVPPTEAPYRQNVAGSGIVESATENIAIGPVVPGVVMKLYVKVGDLVKAGDPLFQVDDRDLQSELVKAQANLKAVREKVARLESFPRPEEVPPAEAKVRADEQLVADARNQFEMVTMVSKSDARAISRDELDKRRYALSVAEARLAQSQAELSLLKAGSWVADLAVARADVLTAQADIDAVKIELERRVTRAPIDGRVLQLKTRLGEYAPTGVLQQPLILLGGVETLNVRVDVDENDAWRISPGARAEATVRGNRDLKTPLSFVRVEPYVVPKRSLTGESSERVDTRVLQVIYGFDPKRLPNVYVGQQMDVFIEGQEGGVK
jgi:HlyD family secretion protein